MDDMDDKDKFLLALLAIIRDIRLENLKAESEGGYLITNGRWAILLSVGWPSYLPLGWTWVVARVDSDLLDLLKEVGLGAIPGVKGRRVYIALGTRDSSYSPN